MKKNKIPGIVAIIFTVLSLALTVVFLVLSLKDGENFLESLLGAAMLGFTFGGMIPGFCHVTAIHQKIKFLLLIPFAGWAIYLMLIIGVPYLGGWIFMLVDLFRFLKDRKGGQA